MCCGDRRIRSEQSRLANKAKQRPRSSPFLPSLDRLVHYQNKCPGRRMTGIKRLRSTWYVSSPWRLLIIPIHFSAGKPRRTLHGCAHMGTDAPGRSSRCVIPFHRVSRLRLCDHSVSISVNVHLPKDRISMTHQGFGFCEFLTEEDAEYACKIMNQIKLWGKPIRVNKVRHRPPNARMRVQAQTLFLSRWQRRPPRTRSNLTLARIYL